jgi:hypothetical protein
MIGLITHLHREEYVLTLLATVGGDVGYDKLWDRLIANSLKWRGNVSVIHLQDETLDLATLDHATNKILGSAVGDLSYRIDPAKIDVGRQETLSQIEFFNRILKELERREELRRQAELEVLQRIKPLKPSPFNCCRLAIRSKRRKSLPSS